MIAMQGLAMEIADEKVNMVSQAYELVRCSGDCGTTRVAVVTCYPFRGGLALQLDVHIRRLDHQMKCLETAMKARGEVAVCCVECQVWRLCDVCYVIGDPPAQAFRLTCYQQRRRMPACRRDPLASATESSE
jgi:hypothetical protein